MSDDKISSFSEDSSIIGSTGLQYLIPSNDVVFKNSQELLSVSPIGCDVRNSFSPNATSYDPWTQPFGGFLAGNSPVSTTPNNTHKLNSPSTSNLTIPTILSQPQAGSPFQVPSINHGLNGIIPPKAPTAPTVSPHVTPTSFDALSENLSKFTLGKSGHHTDGWIEDWLFGMGGMDGVEAQPMVGLLRRASNTTSTDNFNDPHQSRLKPYSLSPRISPIGSPDIILPTSQPIQSLHQQKQALQQPQQQLQQLQQQQLQLQQQIQQQQQQIQQQQQLQQQQLQQQQMQQRDQPQQGSQREHGQSRGMRSRPQYQQTMSNHTSPSFNNSKQQRYTTSDPISSYSHSSHSHSHSHSAHQSPRDASKLSQYSQQFQQYQQYNNNQPLHPHRNGQGNRDSPRSFESSYESSPRQNVKYFSSSNPALGERERTHSHSHSSQSSSFTQESSSFYGSSEEESGSYSMSQGDGSYSPNFKGNGNPNNKSNKYRGWSNSKKEYDLSRFELDVVKVLSGEEKRTTLMVKNIPNKYTQEMLLETISENHKGLYDFFYLPIDFKNKCNVGYSFINFIDPLSIPNFYMEFNQKRWSKFNSSKVCKITYARIQGKSAFIEHFRNSSLMNEEIKCRPLIFYGSGPQQGLPEPFPDPRAIMPNSSTSPSNTTNSTGSIGSNSVRTNSTVGNLPTVEIHPASFERDNRQPNGNNNNGSQSGNGMKMNGEIEVLSSRGDGEIFNYRNAI